MTQKKKLIRISEVIDRTGYGRSWIYNLIKKNSFPMPVKTGERTIAFVENEVDAWIDENIFPHVIRLLKLYYQLFIYNLKRLPLPLSIKCLKIAYRAF